jgi:hypothetical protein
MRRGYGVFALIVSLTLVGCATTNADCPNGQEGFFQKVWRLEQRKNQWLRETFFGARPREEVAPSPCP